jgi:hypothetical protein
VQELAVLGVGALSAAGVEQHVEVTDQDRHRVGEVVGDETLDDQHPRSLAMLRRQAA